MAVPLACREHGECDPSSSWKCASETRVWVCGGMKLGGCAPVLAVSWTHRQWGYQPVDGLGFLRRRMRVVMLRCP